MCRNIKPLFNFEPPATDDEVRASALQFVRKVSGYTKPSKMNEDYVKAYNAAYNRNPDIYSIGAWDGMNLIYEALKKTGGKADGQALIDAAKGMTWESPRGPITIDPETRDIIQTVYIYQVQKVGGELKNVEIDKVENVKDPVKARMKK